MRPLLSILALIAFPLAVSAEPPADTAFRPRTPPATETATVKSGTYTTGDAQGGSGERPVRRVSLPAFQIKRTEVTNAEYLLCVKDGVCTEARDYVDRRRPELPVAGVSWFQARDYCLWWGGRLPSEAEWEAAARTTAAFRFPWGNEFDWSKGNFADGPRGEFGREDHFEEAAPAGSFPDGATESGIMDLAGNLAEWVGDWFDPLYYTRSPNQSPKGPPWGQQKILKGGSYRTLPPKDGPNPYRAAAKDSLPPEMARPDVGFRCVYDGKDPTDNTDPEPAKDGKGDK
jgi:iron(II)-dependent oxidoreductase